MTQRLPEWLPAALRLGHGYQMTTAKRLTPQGSTLHARVRELDNTDTEMVLNEAQWVWALDKAVELMTSKDAAIGVSALPPDPRRFATEMKLHVCSKLWRRYLEIKTT